METLAADKAKSNGFQPGILVDRQIRHALDIGMLVITPFNEESLEPATYDIRVGAMAAVTTETHPLDLRDKKVLTIEPGAMALLESLEVFTLSPRIAGRIGPKSRLMRSGILVSTGPQIDPGFHGRLTVNLINLSPRTFVLEYGEEFLSIEFHHLSESPDETYEGDYQDRMGLSSEELQTLFAYQGPTLVDIHRGFKDVATHVREFADFRETLEQQLKSIQLSLEGKHLNGTDGDSSIKVAINDLSEPGYKLLKPIPVVVHLEKDGEHVASFFDGNIHASGDNDQEAFENLRSMILDTFDTLAGLQIEQMARPAADQWALLQRYLKKGRHAHTKRRD